MKRRFPIFILPIFLLLLFLDSQCRITVSHHRVESAALGEDFPGMTVVQLSDIHGREFGPGNRRLLRAVARENPDIIAITGDLLDDDTELASMTALVRDLAAIAPCYYVTGNHEWSFSHVDGLKAAIAEAGATVLDNRWEILPVGSSPILIVGVDDPNGPADMAKPDALVQSLREQYPNRFLLLLGHRNSWIREYPTLDADLVLCGHGHGGLVRIPGLGGLFGTSRNLLPPYTEGLHQTETYAMIVSRGLGNSPGTFRFLNNPEIISVSLKKL